VRSGDRTLSVFDHPPFLNLKEWAGQDVGVAPRGAGCGGTPAVIGAALRQMKEDTQSGSLPRAVAGSL
jgi:hypothetical protein